MSASDDDDRLRLLLSSRLDKLSSPTSISNLKYDLNAGVPDSESLPLEPLRRAFDEVLSLNPKHLRMTPQILDLSL